MNEQAILDRSQFDEEAYIEYYEDIRLALQERRIDSAWSHYDNYGRAEGRKSFFLESHFDEEFYLSAYPMVEDELKAGKASNAREHYQLFGKARGFVPSRNGPRPDNAAALPSAYGGLWPDCANARDIIEGRLETGQITEQQAALLYNWIRDGYVTLEQAIDPQLIEDAVQDLDKAYAGGFPKAKFECHKVTAGLTRWTPEVSEHAAKVLDLHHFSAATRNLMFAPAIGEFLGLIFESKAFASQSLGFLRGSGQEGHQDSAYVPFSIPRRFSASWIALEDVTIGAGELFYYPGSHRFPDFQYGGRYKSIAEAERCGHTVERAEVEKHVASLVELAKAHGLEKKVLAAKKGDVLFWHADLVHGGNPVSADVTRKSLVTHYCPKRMSPLFSETTHTDIYEHNGHLFTSHLYPQKQFVK